ncbi:hypothetical protein LEP1GSC036_2342 [Leptospira weilii str. 2006001853]|uniref:Uncharacterized protein n=3 Tax=Leptospira weilii TaxID=28184 RepID=A0A828YXR7_9LEPT|nr:hypothetical protein [Leptospira weilii]EMM70955.1 hypothetical protein LEP1GSC038_1583 [Leptospira weilii str. 2006001855]EKR62895.1 hypothetical protein LEP1GSC036_2342 [Leptospira weilii str. 2006001853]EMN45485.1 hypothetical protein LEP1GSC086_3950 [Leptospira weilii str. LNT 1234]EMN92113.1 hypothetical protein LEP1GSC108_3047 [Leptospira weilii str. UI 13098]MCL8267543.1 hypothetical protein [Leptospira weilii]
MMLFIAIALILIGLLCFIYVSLNPNSGRELRFKSNIRKENSQNEHLSRHEFDPRKGAEILAATKRAPNLGQIEKQKHLEDLFVEGRKIPKQDKVLQPVASSAEFFDENISSIEEEFSRMEEVPSRSGVEVLEEPSKFSSVNEEKSKEEEVKEIRFEIDGILYLDQNRELLYEKLTDKKKELIPDKLKSLKRIGPGKLSENRDFLSFEALNSSYKYFFSEIEKILFFDEGIVLISSKQNYPIPVFFTKETNQLKSYLESSSQTFSN